MEKTIEEKQKQRYEKPVVRRFPLRPEEAVLGFCKSTSGGGPSAGPCHSVFCKSTGS